MAEILRKKQKEYATEVLLISDEPYRELAYNGAEVPYVTKYYENAVVCYSFSKSLSLPGERIGYVAIPDEVTDSADVIQAATIANRVLGSVNAPSLIQRAIIRCLDAKVNVKAYDKNRNALYNGLTDLGFECVYPQGAFYMWVKSPVENEKEFCDECKKYNLLVVPGSSFAGPGYVRIAYCVSYDMIMRSMQAFAKVAEHYGLKK
jgi:aspartate aminotransferase